MEWAAKLPALCLPPVGHSRFYCIYSDPWLTGSSGAISPECQCPNRRFFGILSLYLEWMDQLLRIFHRLWGQILSFALCASCIKVKIKWHEFEMIVFWKIFKPIMNHFCDYICYIIGQNSTWCILYYKLPSFLALYIFSILVYKCL